MANRDHGSNQPYRGGGGGNNGGGRSDRDFEDSYQYSDRRRASYDGYGDEYYVERRDYYDDSRYSNPQSKGGGKGSKNKRNRPNSSKSDRERELDGNDSDTSTQSEPPFDKRKVLYSNKPFSKSTENKIESNRDSKMKETEKEKRNPIIENRSTNPVSGVNSKNISNPQADPQKDSSSREMNLFYPNPIPPSPTTGQLKLDILYPYPVVDAGDSYSDITLEDDSTTCSDLQLTDNTVRPTLDCSFENLNQNKMLIEDCIQQFESSQIETLSDNNSKEVGLVNQLLCDQITLQSSRDKLYSNKLALTLAVEEMVQFINTTSLEKEELTEKNRILTETKW